MTPGTDDWLEETQADVIWNPILTMVLGWKSNRIPQERGPCPRPTREWESRMGCMIGNGGPGPSTRTTGFFLFSVVGMFTRHSRAEQMSSPVFVCVPYVLP